LKSSGISDCKRRDAQKTKEISKKMKKALEFENRIQEKEFDRASFRKFWQELLILFSATYFSPGADLHR
uniref:Uncharacterized protein LOC104227913 n=1 Tax=Nicotiana sylvestris TaxID=4096 RepID=A0A1U7WV78_NICSY